MITTHKYFIKGDLSEKQIEADVALFMGMCMPPGSQEVFRLLDIDEQKTGADKLFDRGTAIYMQFKKSTGLRPLAPVVGSKKTNKKSGVLEQIREFRAQNGLEDDPTLFFQLHVKAKNAVDLQHNILLSYELPPASRAIYVAPLLLDKERYSNALHRSSERFLLHPFFYRLEQTIYSKLWTKSFGAVPFLREHVSIPPHERVTDHHHYYAYSSTGVDVSWHSPQVVQREPCRLSDFMVSILSGIFDHEESMTSISDLAARIAEAARGVEYSGTSLNQSEDTMAFLGEHGAWLRESHGIRQFILLSNSSALRRLREP